MPGIDANTDVNIGLNTNCSGKSIENTINNSTKSNTGDNKTLKMIRNNNPQKLNRRAFKY